ncbi:hypothetical protein [Microbacterium sp. zg.Y909]|uniref:hypothetical protein n=1 Tax=Microbacterium sp. zg.Y909 TaxID=2969413 RepID=UPI00214AE81E|nr:hypothetical protein [Microbacterium sp. zg.Y909]MCR2826395.1 hypothetical protein [Microbacterium sp. zg.Y909]
MAAIIIVLGAISVMTTSLWSSIGPEHGAFPFCVALMSFAFPIFIGAELAKRIPAGAFRISARSNRLFAALGVKVFDRILTFIRWNALVLNMRKPVTKPSDLQPLAFDLRSAAVGHGCGLLVHVVIAAIALSAGYMEASLWILLPSVPLHAYPIMLQLVNLRRIDGIHEARESRA